MTGPLTRPGQAAGTLAAQADALLAAAAFPGQAGITGLTVAAGESGITILVPRTLAPAARLTTITTLAAAIGAPAPVCTAIGATTLISTQGTTGSHPARVSASIEPEDTTA
jgi:hypothetical protein